MLYEKRIVKMINIILFFMCLAINYSQRIDGMQITLKEDSELERQVKLINKLPVKSIHTKYGYIVDCIDINKQPAFDHPLLKNHKLQRKPSFQQTKAKISANISPAKSNIRLEKVSCPIGTVPIRRTTKDDLIRSKTLLNTQILDQDKIISHEAKVYLLFGDEDPFYAISGSNSIWNPRVNKDQTSAAHIWVQKGEADGTNKIIVGWHVSPQLYGDDATHVYSYWTSDNFKKTGCYNLQCPGFVETAQEEFIGIRVENTSVYNGGMVEMQISLSQDANTKNWWLYIDNTAVGYFPAALFSDLSNADQVGWGGKTTTNVGTPNPSMGSGYFPDDNFVHACYFRYVAYQNSTREDYEPSFNNARTSSDNSNCFGVEFYGDQGGDFGCSLQFGGPGGDCDK